MYGLSMYIQKPKERTTRIVNISMSERFYKQWTSHLDTIGEDNKSSWVRGAIRRKMNDEQGADAWRDE